MSMTLAFSCGVAHESPAGAVEPAAILTPSSSALSPWGLRVAAAGGGETQLAALLTTFIGSGASTAGWARAGVGDAASTWAVADAAATTGAAAGSVVGARASASALPGAGAGAAREEALSASVAGAVGSVLGELGLIPSSAGFVVSKSEAGAVTASSVDRSAA